jgi:micrococcal nuclease
VVDGDTIVIDRGRGNEKLRYIGMDTPETVDPASPVQWMGPQASAANKALVEGQHVVLERDVSETDQYGRLLRYVWLAKSSGWLLVNLELVVEGVAQAATYPPDVRYVDLYLSAQRTAQEQGIGLWGATPPPTQAPAPFVEVVPTPGPATPGCHPSYVGVCLQTGIGDYDCAGGSGNGPNYVKGPFKVVGPDEFRLDADGNGIGCG